MNLWPNRRVVDGDGDGWEGTDDVLTFSFPRIHPLKSADLFISSIHPIPLPLVFILPLSHNPLLSPPMIPSILLSLSSTHSLTLFSLSIIRDSSSRVHSSLPPSHPHPSYQTTTIRSNSSKESSEDGGGVGSGQKCALTLMQMVGGRKEGRKSWSQTHFAYWTFCRLAVFSHLMELPHFMHCTARLFKVQTLHRDHICSDMYNVHLLITYNTVFRALTNLALP